MSQIQNLREYLLKECAERGSPSLVDIVAHFDYHQHCIPILNEMRLAIKDIKDINIIRNEIKISLIIECSDTVIDVNDITDIDMQETYASYLKHKTNRHTR